MKESSRTKKNGIKQTEYGVNGWRGRGIKIMVEERHPTHNNIGLKFTGNFFFLFLTHLPHNPFYLARMSSRENAGHRVVSRLVVTGWA